jgi:hypothetical protein
MDLDFGFMKLSFRREIKKRAGSMNGEESVHFKQLIIQMTFLWNPFQAGAKRDLRDLSTKHQEQL